MQVSGPRCVLCFFVMCFFLLCFFVLCFVGCGRGMPCQQRRDSSGTLDQPSIAACVSLLRFVIVLQLTAVGLQATHAARVHAVSLCCCLLLLSHVPAAKFVTQDLRLHEDRGPAGFVYQVVPSDPHKRGSYIHFNPPSLVT